MDAIAKHMANVMVRRSIVEKAEYGRAVYASLLLIYSVFISLVMVLIALITWTLQAALMYMLAYFVIRTCGPTPHYRYLFCFSLSEGLYISMTVMLKISSPQALFTLTLMVLLCCFGTLLSGALKECGHPFPIKSQLLKWGMWLVGFTLLAFPGVNYAFPFAFGMLVINLSQLKVRSNENG